MLIAMVIIAMTASPNTRERSISVSVIFMIVLIRFLKKKKL